MSTNSEPTSNQAVVDVSMLPKNFPSLCIPRMFPNITKERVLQVFGDLDICDIDHVDMIQKTSPTGEKFQRVFIHMLQWKINPQAVRARARVLEGKEIKIIYDDPWFWKVSANRSSPNQNTAVVSNIRNLPQKARVFMDLDCDNVVNNNNNNNNNMMNTNVQKNTHKYNHKIMKNTPTNSTPSATASVSLQNTNKYNTNNTNNNQNRGKYTKILTKNAAPTVLTLTIPTPSAVIDMERAVASVNVNRSVPTVFEPSSPTSPPPNVAVKMELEKLVLVKRRPRTPSTTSTEFPRKTSAFAALNASVFLQVVKEEKKEKDEGEVLNST